MFLESEKYVPSLGSIDHKINPYEFCKVINRIECQMSENAAGGVTDRRSL
jgi:hypothetical protein